MLEAITLHYITICIIDKYIYICICNRPKACKHNGDGRVPQYYSASSDIGEASVRNAYIGVGGEWRCHWQGPGALASHTLWHALLLHNTNRHLHQFCNVEPLHILEARRLRHISLMKKRLPCRAPVMNESIAEPSQRGQQATE